jgi:signal transduction histidine kinase
MAHKYGISSSTVPEQGTGHNVYSPDPPNHKLIMPDSPNHRFEAVFQFGPMTIAVTYLICGLLWVYFSNSLAIQLADGDDAGFHLLSTFKGFAFILVTAILLYATMLYYIRKAADGQAALRRSEQEIRVANKKLSLMSDITYQDIQNKVTAARGFVELGQTAPTELARNRYLERSTETLNAIQTLIFKTKAYQQMGIYQLRWIPVEPAIRVQFSLLSLPHPVTLACDVHGLEVYADPLIDQVFYNLCLNAVTHGERTTRIAFTYRETADSMVLVCEDDGIGITPEQKPHIFNRVVGGIGKFHLFFVREFLAMYGMKITETGTAGIGARFEIAVPKGSYRFVTD